MKANLVKFVSVWVLIHQSPRGNMVKSNLLHHPLQRIQQQTPEDNETVWNGVYIIRYPNHRDE